MIHTKNTVNMAGIIVSGDYLDFEELYEALHYLLPEEGEDLAFEAARIRVLGLCYDIRHAMYGHRDIINVDNGLNRDTFRDMGYIGSQQNIYFSFPTYYPEMLFIMMTLNHYIKEHDYVDPFSPVDKSLLAVKKFQSSVIECLRETLSSQKFLNTVRSINTGSRNLKDYMTQYLDLLNIRFLEWDKEKREKNISILAKRLSERGEEYQKLEDEIYAAATEYDCHPNDLRVKEEYPEFIEW